MSAPETKAELLARLDSMLDALAPNRHLFTPERAAATRLSIAAVDLEETIDMLRDAGASHLLISQIKQIRKLALDLAAVMYPEAYRKDA